MLKYFHSASFLFVTAFWKTDTIVTNTEIHLRMPVDESYTNTLSRDTKHLTIDGLVCFYKWLFLTLSNHKGAFHDLCGP